MIVRHLKECLDTERHIKADDWDSCRLLLKGDGMGFSFHITTIKAGAELELHYQNHLESVYCISGKGSIECLDDGKKYDINPGTVYALNLNDKHILRADVETKFACVFNPPCVGDEVHDESGAYPIDATD